MKINGYEIAISEQELDKKLCEETLIIDLVSKDFEGYKNLDLGDKKAIALLVEAAKIMNDVSLEQDHPMNLVQKKALEDVALTSDYARKTLALFNSLNGVEGSNGIDKDPIEIFEGIKGYLGRNFYPTDLNAEELHEILIKMLKENKVKEVDNILHSRTIVRRKNGELEAIDYTKYFAKEFEQIANKLKEASQYVTDKDFAQYLVLQANALLSNDEELDMKADMKWAGLQNCNLELTISRENYDDSMTTSVHENRELRALLEKHHIDIDSKDMLGMRVGIVNKEGTELILKFKDCMGHLAGLMPFSDTYEQNISKTKDVGQTMVDVDLVELKGDYAQCRGGITTAQNLPNNDKLSVKRGGGRRNVYHRQVRMTSDKEKVAKILNGLVSKDLHKFYNEESDHLFVIGHENGHSFGPNSSYQTSLGRYKHIIEEHKADVVSIAFMPQYVKAGIIDEKTLKEVYTTWVIRRLFLIAKAKFDHPHRVADLMQFNYLLDNKVVLFDEDEKLEINFDLFEGVMMKFLEETIKVQLSKSPDIAKDFIHIHSHWGEHSVRISHFLKELGLKPYKQIKTYF